MGKSPLSIQLEYTITNFWSLALRIFLTWVILFKVENDYASGLDLTYLSVFLYWSYLVVFRAPAQVVNQLAVWTSYNPVKTVSDIRRYRKDNPTAPMRVLRTVRKVFNWLVDGGIDRLLWIVGTFVALILLYSVISHMWDTGILHMIILFIVVLILFIGAG